MPLKNILRRQNLINLSLDNLIEQIRDAVGTQGSVSNRLNQSINADGSLKSSAIDSALHSIAEHADTDDFVRMTKPQADKLALIDNQATSLTLQVFTDDINSVDFSSGPIKIKASNSVMPVIESSNVLKFNLGFPVEAAHQHFYGLTPVDENTISPDYQNYKVNSLSSAFVEGSLRVWVNGFRIFQDAEVYVPGALVEDPWTLMSFTEDHENGKFVLSTAVSENDAIRIDFDISFV